MTLLFGSSHLTSKKTGLPFSATVIRFPSFRLRQPGHPRNLHYQIHLRLSLGPAAFRPTIARGLAFSVYIQFGYLISKYYAIRQKFFNSLIYNDIINIPPPIRVALHKNCFYLV